MGVENYRGEFEGRRDQVFNISDSSVCDFPFFSQYKYMSQAGLFQPGGKSAQFWSETVNLR